MISLSNGPVRFLLLFGLGLTIGTTNATAQKPVEAKSSRVLPIEEATLSFSLPGVLEMVAPQQGSEIKEGELIISLKDEVARVQRDVAKKEADNDVEIRYAEKASEVAQAEYEKALDANRRLEYTVSTLEIERLKLAAERALLQIEQAEFQLAVAALRADEAEANLRMHHITAPFDGVVTDRFKTRGQAVSQAVPVLNVIRTDAVKVEGWVTLAESARIKPGDKVTIQLQLPDGALPLGERPFEGVLRGEAPDVDPIRLQVRVWAEIPNPDNILKVGLGAKMTITPQKGSVETTYLEK